MLHVIRRIRRIGRIRPMWAAVCAAVLVPVGLRAACGAGVPKAEITDPAYGATADDDRDDTAAIQKALDALAEPGLLVIPPGTFRVSMAQGIAVSRKQVAILVQGTVLATAQGLKGGDAKDVFRVTGAGCSVIGQGGMIVGDGSVFSDLMGPRETYPALVGAVGARDFSISGLRLRNPPGVHVRLVGTVDTRVAECVFEGGTPKVEQEERRPYSHFFGLYFVGANGLLIQGNRFKPWEDRFQYQWITSSSTSHNRRVIIQGNSFDGAGDHAVYCCGLVSSVIADNVASNNRGSALKAVGTDLVITGNHVFGAPGGGIEARNASRALVANNLVRDYGHVAIEISSYNDHKGDYTDNVVTGNVLLGNPELKTEVYCGVRILSAGKVSRSKVTDNLIAHAAHPQYPAILIAGGERSDAVMVSNNTLTACATTGIQLGKVDWSQVANNLIETTGKPVSIGDGQNVTLRDNMTRNAPE